jgi:hypothetical protein
MTTQPATTLPTAPADGDGPLARLLWLAFALAAFAVAARTFRYAPCWGVFGLAAVVAWPLWAERVSQALFHRRLLLAGVVQPRGRLRRWLWQGWLTRILAVATALLGALLLLGFGTLLRPEHWVVLALDVLLLSLLAGPLRRRLAAEVRGEHLGLVLRRWPLLGLNLLLLALAFLVVDFAVSSVPDTRGLVWGRVAEDAFNAVAEGTGCPLAGWLGGTLAAVQDLSRHAAQLVIPRLPDPGIKLAAWAMVLAHAGLLAWLMTAYLLGVMALRERHPGGAGDDGGSAAAAGAAGPASLAFVYTILVLAVPYLYATAKLRDFDPTLLAQRADRVVAWTNPCRLDA